ncbi:unnamed protein product [Dimorphilus gyrociliatus]|uniref:Vacuolar protein sorting-associated protein 26C n=1 Tax=Dimorphilus gyrociliatus TaxID=2664684 RepID=A0A7I8V876_9ANNE|nr:unnamed protein product [Dimorphilus gyrociliatus]
MSDVHVDIRLRRITKIYNEGDSATGVVLIVNNTKSDVSHQGVTLALDGRVNLKMSSKNIGVFESFYNSVKPIQLTSANIDILKPGRVKSGRTELPFEIPLKPRVANRPLYETYHGLYVNIEYMLMAEMKRSLRKDLRKEIEIVVEYKDKEQSFISPESTSFTLNPNSVQKTAKERETFPRFVIKGDLKTQGPIGSPMTGEITIESCEQPIKSIELQLMRVEVCGCAEGYSKDATEIQNIQIAEGDPCRNVAIPIYMVYPRLYTCPTLTTRNFQVEFEVNIIVIFQSQYLVSQKFPLQLSRF